MAAGRKKRTSRATGFRFTILIIVFVLLYTLPRLIKFVDTGTNQYVIAKSGSIDDSLVLEGVITRNEQLFSAVSDGIVQYYYPGGQSLSKNTVIATIRDAQYYGSLLTDRKEAINAKIADLSLVDSEYAEEFSAIKETVESNVNQYLKTRDISNYDTIYALKEMFSTSVRQRQDLYSLLSGSAAKTLLEEQEILENVEDEASENLWTSEAGIISYSYDGYEGWDASMIDDTFIQSYNSEYQFLNINMEEVKKGDPLYRIVTSQYWYFTTFLSADEVKHMELEDAEDVRLYDGDRRLTGYVDSLEQVADDEYKLVVRFQSQVQNYLDERVTTLTYSKNTYEGMKIPNNCLTELNFFEVPADCVFAQGSQYGVMVRGSEDVFAPVDFVWSTDNFSYFKNATELVHEGSVILEQGSTATYTLQAPVPSAGVYTVNGVTETFRHVQVLYQTDDYAIVEGISQYDHVKILSD